MNIRALLIPVFALIALSGCGQRDQAAAPSAAAPQPSGSSLSARTVEITANDQMQFNVKAIEAKPGEELRVVLTNVGMMPKEAMAHNWVLLKAGSDVMAFSGAAASAREQNFIPPNLQGEVLAKIDLLGPKQKGEVTFKAPDQPGEYPFLCSFPGHGVLMKGALTVK